MPSGDCCSGLPAGGDCSGLPAADCRGLPAGDCRGLPAGDCMSMSGSGISSLLKKNNTLIPTKLLLQWLSFRVQYSEKSKDCIIYSHGDGSSLTLLTCFLYKRCDVLQILVGVHHVAIERRLLHARVAQRYVVVHSSHLSVSLGHRTEPRNVVELGNGG